MRLLALTLTAGVLLVAPAVAYEPYRPSEPWTWKRLKAVIRADVYTVFPVPEPLPGYYGHYSGPHVRLPAVSPYSMINYGIPLNAAPLQPAQPAPPVPPPAAAPELPPPRPGAAPPAANPPAKPPVQPTTLPDLQPRFLPTKSREGTDMQFVVPR